MTIGIDCGGNKVAIFDIDNLATHVLDINVRKMKYERGVILRRIEEYLRRLAPVAGFEDRDIYVEAPVLAGARNIQSTIKVAQTTGVVHAVLAKTHEVAVSSWKKATVGNGNASKPQVQAWLDENHPRLASMCRGNQDLYDAACIALYGRELQQELEAP